VQGCWFKRDGRIVQNPDRPAAPLSSLPAPAYDLIDFDAYERASGERKLPYATSIGCPTPAITAPIWCSTTAASIRTTRRGGGRTRGLWCVSTG
jgi:hypothetical protein